jgi:hypothetical protein
MVTNVLRNHNCKDEELPVICNFAVFSIKRDLVDFTAYSPMFNQEYVTGFEAKTKDVAELIAPKSETVEKKKITDRLHKTMDGLIGPVNYLKGYIEMAGGTLNISAADFGLTPLRNGIKGKDAENVLKNLQLVITNTDKYKTPLVAKGLGEPLIAKFVDAKTSIAADKQKQYEITSKRKGIVQDNLGLLNDLYDQLSEILRIGKILYQQTDPAKLKDYTFTELMKQVRKTVKMLAVSANGTLTEVMNSEAVK